MMKKKQTTPAATNHSAIGAKKKTVTSRPRSKSKEKSRVVKEEDSKEELRLTQEIGDINLKLEKQRNPNAKENYQSRN